nr:MAG TPA: hypothetical protein [Caudoviricetes sp.]
MCKCVDRYRIEQDFVIIYLFESNRNIPSW